MNKPVVRGRLGECDDGYLFQLSAEEFEEWIPGQELIKTFGPFETKEIAEKEMVRLGRELESNILRSIKSNDLDD